MKPNIRTLETKECIGNAYVNLCVPMVDTIWSLLDA